MEKINEKYKWWEFFWDEDSLEGEYPQCIGFVHGDEWISPFIIFQMPEGELREFLTRDCEYAEVSKNAVRYAMKELEKLKVKYPQFLEMKTL